jgi:hypothetical protein
MAMIAIKSNELTHIQSFLHAHGWKKQGQSNYFDCYAAPATLQLPTDYVLEVPRDATDKGYNRYTEGLIDILHDLYGDSYNVQTIQTFFCTDHFILSLQLAMVREKKKFFCNKVRLKKTLIRKKIPNQRKKFLIR